MYRQCLKYAVIVSSILDAYYESLSGIHIGFDNIELYHKFYDYIDYGSNAMCDLRVIHCSIENERRELYGTK